MKLRELLEELTTKPEKFSLKKHSDDSYVASFKINDKEYTVNFDRDVAKTWGLAFSLMTKKHGIRYATTGTGNANIVFSTILATIKAFIEREKPEEIFFDNLERSRGRTAIYTRFIKNIDKYIPGYYGEVYNSQFVLKKKR